PVRVRRAPSRSADARRRRPRAPAPEARTRSGSRSVGAALVFAGSRGSGAPGSLLTMRAMALAVLLGTAGCADLPPISVGVCGNGVVEPTSGEDCDGTGKDGATCGEPGTTHECRYMCQDKDAKCPASYSCGLDGLCRTQSSTWSSSASAFG